MLMLKISIILLALTAIVEAAALYNTAKNLDALYWIVDERAKEGKLYANRSGEGIAELRSDMQKLDTTYKSAINTLEDQIAALDKDLHSPYFGAESEEPKGEVWSND